MCLVYTFTIPLSPHSSANSATLSVKIVNNLSVFILITFFHYRNHEFDKRVGGKAKIGTVRKFLELPSGVQSERSHYNVDES